MVEPWVSNFGNLHVTLFSIRNILYFLETFLEGRSPSAPLETWFKVQAPLNCKWKLRLLPQNTWGPRKKSKNERNFKYPNWNEILNCNVTNSWIKNYRIYWKICNIFQNCDARGFQFSSPSIYSINIFMLVFFILYLQRFCPFLFLSWNERRGHRARLKFIRTYVCIWEVI